MSAVLNMKEINWLASYPKSGNTWVRMVYQTYVLGHLDINLNIHLTYSDTVRHIHESVAPFAYDRLSLPARFMLRPAAFMRLIAERPHRPLIVKTHSAAMFANNVLLTPWDMTRSAVVIVRDPRAVIESYANARGTSIEEAADLCRDDGHVLYTEHAVPSMLTSWSEWVRSWRYALNNGLPGVLVRYEDLVAHPEQMFSLIFQTWGVDVDLERLRRAIDAASLPNCIEQEGADGFIEKVGPAETFFRLPGDKATLTEQQERMIIEDHGEVMAEIGYMNDDESVKEMTLYS